MAAGSLQVKAEPYKATEHPRTQNDARLSALIVEAQLYQQLQEQTAQLEEFRNKVQRRLRKQKQDTAEQTIIIEKHPVHEVDPRGVCAGLDSCSYGISVVDCRKERSKCVQQMLSLCENPTPAPPSAPPSLKPTMYKEKPRPALVPRSCTSSKTATEHKQTFSNKAEAANHCLAVRRLYSAVERQQSRVNAINRQHQKEAEKRRQEREEERRQIEKKYLPEESVTAVERENAKQWLEMVALERRHQKLVKEKENERFCEALQFLLHEKHPDLPSLCPCHPSIWDTDPMKCAKNCPFYRNHSKFAKELSSLLRSVTENKGHNTKK